MTIEVTQCSMCKHYSEEQYCEIWQQYITNDAFYCACGAKADRKTESNSGKPNNCELQTIRCPKCGRTDYIRDMEKDMGIKGSHYKYKCINCNTYIKDEPTISKMEQVDEPQTEPLPKTINGVRIADAVAWADKWLEDNSVSEMWDMIRTLRDATEWQDEPQTDFLTFLYNVINPNEMEEYRAMYEAKGIATKDESQTSGVVWTEDAIKNEPKSYTTWASTDEPQTDCAWK